MVNISGVFNAFRLIIKPSLCLPHHTVSTFDQIPFPISQALAEANGGKEPDIRALILDKDNCFAIPHDSKVYPKYERNFEKMRDVYSKDALVIVSNSAGTNLDHEGSQAALLQKSTGLTVLKHAVKKPGCAREVYDYLRSHTQLQITDPSQVAVIGDRLLTDVMMANLIGCWSIWVKDGVINNAGTFARIEKSLPHVLLRMGYRPPHPRAN